MSTLEKTYLSRKAFPICNNKNGSQFWQGVNKVKNKLKQGATMALNNDKNTQGGYVDRRSTSLAILPKAIRI
jgi:hypothetical protein